MAKTTAFTRAAAADVTARAGDGGEASCCLYDNASAGLCPTTPKASEVRVLEEEAEGTPASYDDNDDDDILADAAAAAASAAAADTADVADDASKDGTGGLGCCTTEVRKLSLLSTAETWDQRSRWEDGELR